jgi:beta-1,4-N-acetylglucosaminyltransferase
VDVGRKPQAKSIGVFKANCQSLQERCLTRGLKEEYLIYIDALNFMSQRKTVFVTVGTTLFEDLVDAMCCAETLPHLENAGFTDLVVQHGKGLPPQNCSGTSLHCRYYDFQPSLSDDMAKADLIVSHAGAGTIMEAIQIHQNKKLCVVINESLMDNHQIELAHAMESRGHLVVVERARDLLLATTWHDRILPFQPKPYQHGDERDFANTLDRFLGFEKKMT